MCLISRAHITSSFKLNFAKVDLGLYYFVTVSAQLCQTQYYFQVPSALFCDQNMRKVIKITGLLFLAWWIAITATVAFLCIPVRAIPQVRQSSGHCIINKELYLAYEVPNCILNFWIIAMPVLKIKKMQLSPLSKICLFFFSVLAGLYVIFPQFWFFSYRSLAKKK